MNTLRAILIDDEENSLNSLKVKIQQHCPNVEVIATCSKSADGLEAVNKMHPDLLFLDIEMPLMNGFVLLKNLEFKDFELIFVTAFDHYAIKAIQASALDYLMKPVSPEALKAAVERAFEKNIRSSKKQLDLLIENTGKRELRRIAIPTTDGLAFIRVDDIVYLEASVNYTKIFLNNGDHYMVSRTLKDFEDMLPQNPFLRIHNSYIINLDYAEKYVRGEGGQVVLKGDIILEVSKRKKNELLKMFTK